MHLTAPRFGIALLTTVIVASVQLVRIRIGVNGRTRHHAEQR